MAINKKDIKELTTEELWEKVRNEKSRYKKLRFNHEVSPLDNPNMLKELRKDIARLMTEIRERELKEEQETSTS